MANWVKAGTAYFLTVFAFGCLLGPIRILWLDPIVGINAAVLLELPFILTFSWIVCLRVIKALAIPERFPQRLGMGVLAFLCLMISDYLLAHLAFGQSFSQFSESLKTTAGIFGLLGQALFALFPILQVNVASIRKEFTSGKTH